jgi:hypothetical protein
LEHPVRLIFLDFESAGATKDYEKAGNSGERLSFRLAASTMRSTDRSASELIQLSAAMNKSICACLDTTGDRELAL